MSHVTLQTMAKKHVVMYSEMGRPVASRSMKMIKGKMSVYMIHRTYLPSEQTAIVSFAPLFFAPR